MIIHLSFPHKGGNFKHENVRAASENSCRHKNNPTCNSHWKLHVIWKTRKNANMSGFNFWATSIRRVRISNWWNFVSSLLAHSVVINIGKVTNEHEHHKPLALETKQWQEEKLNTSKKNFHRSSKCETIFSILFTIDKFQESRWSLIEELLIIDTTANVRKLRKSLLFFIVVLLLLLIFHGQISKYHDIRIKDFRLLHATELKLPRVNCEKCRYQ